VVPNFDVFGSSVMHRIFGKSNSAFVVGMNDDLSRTFVIKMIQESTHSESFFCCFEDDHVFSFTAEESDGILRLRASTDGCTTKLVKIAFSWFSIVVTSPVCIRIINEDLRFDKSIPSSRNSLGSGRFVEQLFQCSVIELEENRDI